MLEQEAPRGKHGPATVLAILFGLLVGLSGSSGPLQPDASRPRLGNGDIFRTASGYVLAGRHGDQGPDEAAPTALPAAPPRIVTRLLSSRPIASDAAFAAAAPRLERVVPYRSRAPPAA